MIHESQTNQIFDISECSRIEYIYYKYRCPNCKNHGEDIDTRGDCKNLINKEGMTIQCSCYSEEHK